MQKIFLKLCLVAGLVGLFSCSKDAYWLDGYSQNNLYIEDEVTGEGSPSNLAKVFNMRVPEFNTLLVCRDKQCAPAEMATSRQYIFNALAHLVDNNGNEKALLCEANPQAHVCINPYLTVPAKIGVVPSYVYFDSVKVIDASLVKGTTAINLTLGYNLSYNGQTPSVCKPDKSLLYVKDNKSIILGGEGFKCDMPSMGTTTIRVMFDIDYVDMDYGYIGGYYSIGLSGPANGGGSGYGMIRLPNDAFPLNPVLMEMAKKESIENLNPNMADSAVKEAEKTQEVKEEPKAEEKAVAKEEKVEEVKDDVNAVEVSSEVTDALKEPRKPLEFEDNLADNILKEDEGIVEDVYFDENEEVNIDDLEEYIK